VEHGILVVMDRSRGAVEQLPLGEDQVMTTMGSLLVPTVAGRKVMGNPLDLRMGRYGRDKSVFLAQTQYFLKTEREIFYQASADQ
jgi:hypothetical protein